MTLLANALLIIVAAAMLQLAQGAMIRRWPCRCGRSIPPYFYVRHERIVAMVIASVARTVALCLLVLPGGTPVLLKALALLVIAMIWRGVYLHERDKITRALRAAGRVVLDANNRLRVVQA